MSGNNDYLCIRAWDRMMGSFTYFTTDQIQRARDQKQPQDVIYEKGGYDKEGKKIEGQWVRLPEVTSANTQWYFKQNHPDLVEKYAPEWLTKGKEEE